MGRSRGEEKRKPKSFYLKPSTIETIRMGANAARIKDSHFVDRVIEANNITLAVASNELESHIEKLQERMEKLNLEISNINDLVKELRELSKRLGGK